MAKIFNNRECMVAFKRGEYKCMGQTVHLMHEPYCLVCYKKVSYADLTYIPMIRYRTDHSVVLIFDNWCSENLITPSEVTMELDSMVTCRHFIREGLGWSVLPYLGLGSCRSIGNLYIEPLRDKNNQYLIRNTDLAYEDESLKLGAVCAFVDFVKTYYQKQKIPQGFI